MLNFRLNGNTYKSVYGGFGEALANLNDAYKKDSSVDSKLNVNSMIQYQYGESPTALFAVRSLGIDPATGKEVFLTKNGTPTFDYNADDRVKIADTNPKIRGVFGISFTYKNLQASVNLRYNLGSFAFNSALFNKVENISASNIAYNQDKRITVQGYFINYPDSDFISLCSTRQLSAWRKCTYQLGFFQRRMD